ncbi:hypothetical protein [Streptomyces sp. NPDC056049]|uniref:hypothetical protein n=1 Tax=Streptomyces sp. NPDC056049 TaxID=3345693 RepID=UPI0035E0B675
MFGRRKARKSEGELGPAGVPWLNYPAPAWPQEPAPVEETPAAPASEDFLPADLRLDLSTKRFLVWRRPLVLEGEVRSCPQCAAYRDWAILAVEGQIWLRCPAKHVTPEPRLSLEWFNRNAGPTSSTYGSLDEGLDDFGL